MKVKHFIDSIESLLIGTGVVYCGEVELKVCKAVQFEVKLNVLCQKQAFGAIMN